MEVAAILAAIGGITAAVFSVVNVRLSARLANRGKLDEWRRDQEQPIVARLLTLSHEAAEKWMFIELTYRSQPDALDEQLSDWHSGEELRQKIDFEVAQLDLVAGHALRKAAAHLRSEHLRMMMRTNPRQLGQLGLSGISGKNFRPGLDLLDDLSDRVRDEARVDLGMDRPKVDPLTRFLNGIRTHLRGATGNQPPEVR